MDLVEHQKSGSEHVFTADILDVQPVPKFHPTMPTIPLPHVCHKEAIYTTTSHRILTKATSPRGSVVRARSVDFGTSEVEALFDKRGPRFESVRGQALLFSFYHVF